MFAFGLFSNLQKKKTKPNCLHQAKEFWEMDLKEKLELAAEVKSKGNQYFKVHFDSNLKNTNIFKSL